MQLMTITFSILLQFLNQDEHLKGIDVYVSIIKAYASYFEHTRKEASRDELLESRADTLHLKSNVPDVSFSLIIVW
jgi:hypothetical protein